MRKIPFISGFAGLALLISLAVGRADNQPSTVQKTEHFDKDPGWEGFNNRVVPAKLATVSQDFGYSPTNFAGKEKGEIGGLVQRAGKPAFYADKIPVKTLNDKLSASGTFALTRHCRQHRRLLRLVQRRPAR